MTNKEILDGNQIIAEFDGMPTTSKHKTFSGGIDVTDVRVWKYHEDWRLLMNVIEKIGNIKFEDYENEQDVPYPRTFGMKNEHGKYMFRFNRYGLHDADTLIEAAWLAVVDFIKSNHETPPL